MGYGDGKNSVDSLRACQKPKKTNFRPAGNRHLNDWKQGMKMTSVNSNDPNSSPNEGNVIDFKNNEIEAIELEPE